MTRTARLATALAVNGALVVGQVAAGVVGHSAGLLADAGHNLTDVAAVAVSLLAVRWAMRPRSDERTFGNHRGTILAALFNAAMLAAVTVAIVAESVVRLLHPEQVDAALVVAVAAVAMVANAAAALVLHEGGHDLNMRSAFVHMAADVLASAAVLAAGVVILATGGGAWDRADPVAALVVAALIVVQAVRLLRESADVLLESTPPDLDLGTLRSAITGVPGVGEVHDLHVWSLSGDVRALSAHLVLTGHPTLEQAQEVGGQVRDRVVDPFGIAHTTFELECERCAEEAGDPCGVDDVREGRGPVLAGPGVVARTRDDPE
ncbi:MAG: cation diffusion facilitator family transporter [Acidimicrobiales bacterium]